MENDRYRLVLLLYKKNRSFIDRHTVKRLKRKYPDNEGCQGKIIDELFKRGLIAYMNAEGYQDDDGNFRYKYPDLPKYYQTNDRGEEALTSALFPSEIREKQRQKRFRNIQVIGISIAAVGGLITLLTFLYENIDGLFK